MTNHKQLINISVNSFSCNTQGDSRVCTLHLLFPQVPAYHEEDSK